MQWCQWLTTTFPLSANSLTIAIALSWVTSSFGARPPRTTQSKGMAVWPTKMTQSRGMAVRVLHSSVVAVAVLVADASEPLGPGYCIQVLRALAPLLASSKH